MDEETKKQEGQEETQRLEKPLDKITAPELREIAREIPGVTGVHAMKKEQLLEIVKEYKGIKDVEPAKKREKTAQKVILNAKELKGKIGQLREEKKAAREIGERKKVKRLRRRINRLKKQTRKVAQL